MAKVKILADGQTDIDSTEIWRYAFHSDYPTWKIAEQGSSSLTFTAGTTFAEHTVTHNLGYVPFFTPSMEYNGQTQHISQFTLSGQTVAGNHPVHGAGSYELVYTCTISTTTLKIGVFLDIDGLADPDSNVSLTAKWLIKLDEY